MNRRHRSRRGFTLVEVLLALPLMVIVCGGVIWALVVAFRLHRTIDGDLNRLDKVLSVITRVSRETANSHGMMRFTPQGQPYPTDGLVVRGSKILVFDLGPEGDIRQWSYSFPTFRLLDVETIASGFTYFHLVNLPRGIHMNVDAGDPQAVESGSVTGGFIDLATAVKPRYW